MNSRTTIVLSSLILVVLLGFGMFFYSSHSSAGDSSQGDRYGLLGAREFIEKFKATPGAVLIDVRTPEEYQAGHIQNSINLDFYAETFPNQIAQLDPEKTYFIYCRSGNRSGQTMELMHEAGINKVYDLYGGVSASPSLLSM